MAKYLITSALPYINGVKHLGNLVGSLLPADIHARFRRQVRDEVLFICATDEHGTPAELAAQEAGSGIAEYCQHQHAIQADIYRRFHLSFDHFGRSSAPQNHDLTRRFYAQLDANGLIAERSIRQFFSRADNRFLPDRYVIGTCPYCGYERARGDQCEACTRVLDPTDLVAPRSAVSGDAALEIRETRHLFLRQSALVEPLKRWIASRNGWPNLVTSIAQKWLDEGLKDRCITRDLEWGVRVPRQGFEDKVFYVWFDAPIAYIAATREWAERDPANRDWREWWCGRAREEVRYIQFMGKDNVPFHTIGFPATLLGSGEAWKTVDVIKGFNWLTYEGGRFSTSARRGIFTDVALEELPADIWRWWLAANAPENADSDFAVARFAADVNHDLADTFGNLVNRCARFLTDRYRGVVPAGGADGPLEIRFRAEIDAHVTTLHEHHVALNFRKAAGAVRAIWSLANVYLAASAPWARLASDPDAAACATRTGINAIAIAARASWAFMPETASTVLTSLGEPDAHNPRWTADAIAPGRTIAAPPLLFAKLTDRDVDRLARRFRGST